MTALLIIGKTGHQQRLLQRRHGGDSDPFAIQKCAASQLGFEQFPMERVIDHAQDYPAFQLQADRDAKCRKPMCEIGRAIEGVDDPAVWRFPHQAFAALFSQNPVPWKGSCQHFRNGSFRPVVHFRHQVGDRPLFIIHAKIGAVCIGNDLSRLLCGGDRHRFKVLLHHAACLILLFPTITQEEWHLRRHSRMKLLTSLMFSC